MAKQILSIDDLSDGDISRLFFMARSKNYFQLRSSGDNAIMLSAFFEPSTRTRLSFSVAALKLGFKVLDFDPQGSSLKKGESFFETLNTIACLEPSVLITRTACDLEQESLATLPLAIINGGDGCNEHPSQALLDCFTLLESFKCDDLHNKRILIIGNIAHSRVAHSNIKLMRRLGAKISLLIPACLSAPKFEDEYEIFNDISVMPNNFDAVMVLRIHRERLSENLALSDKQYFNKYGLNEERFSALGPKTLLLHPGPQNLFVEIDQNVANHPRSLIKEQVKNGVSIRMALIDFCTAN